MKTDPDTGRPEAHVSNRRLGVQLGASAQLYRPEAMCAEDFRSKDDKLCCPRQIAELLCEDLGKVAMALEALEPDFGRRGVHHGAAPEVRGGAGLQPRGGTTATLPLRAARRLGRRRSHPRLSGGGVSHVFLQAARRGEERDEMARARRRGGRGKAQTKMKHADGNTWEAQEEWRDELSGNFCVPDELVGETRRRLLAQNMIPRITMKDRFWARRMAKGPLSICVHPEDWPAIRA